MDTDEFALAVTTHGRRLAQLAFLLCGERAGAEDLVAEAYARTWPRWSKGAVEELEPYLRRVIVNLALQRRRRLARDLRRRTSVRDVESHQAPDDSAVEHTDMTRALMRVPAPQRAVVVLRYFEDLTEEETARVLGVPVGTVKSRLSRAVAAMRSELEGGSDARGH
ncbi:MAG: SigE family RNA polymerase sigma factor [Nitrososphaerales archaeon]